VIEILKSKPTTRRAVIQIYDAMDMFGDHKEIPCTCTLQFFVRDEKVHLVAHMRSNDVFLGLPHDIFSFTMIQEVVAKELNLGVGTYTHLVGSLHLYKNHKSQVKNYINEGYQSTEIYMPEMPADSPLKLIKQLLDIESDIRNETDVKNKIEKLPDYWADLARILEIHTFFKLKKRATNEQKKSEYLTKIIEVRDQFQHEEFKNYINTRL
jgi:thymidylate synthase